MDLVVYASSQYLLASSRPLYTELTGERKAQEPWFSSLSSSRTLSRNGFEADTSRSH